MKKLLFGAVVLFLMASCAGNGESEKVQEDSSQTADSLAQVEAAQAEVARQDSIRQDSIAKAEKAAQAAAQYDKIVDEYLNAIIKLEGVAKKARSGKNFNYETASNVIAKCNKLDDKIRKVKSELTPEQLEKYKRGQKKFKNSMAWLAG